jgi:hypothetical protein
VRTHQSVRQNPRATALEVSLITEHFGYAPARRQNGKVSAHPAKRKSTSSVLHRHAERRVQFPGTPLVPPPGSRTSGQTAQNVLIAGPSWHGSVPRNLTLVRSSTNTAFIIGRVYSDGTPPDLAQVHKLQAEFKLVPLSSFNKPFTPPALYG